MFDLNITGFNGDEHRPFILKSDGDAAVLCVHGFPGTPAETIDFAREFHSVGYTARGILLPGFGAEINDLPRYTYEHWRNAIVQEMKTLRREHRRVILCGFSMGGALSISASAEHMPDALVLIAPFQRINHLLWTTLPALRYLIPKFKPFKLFKPDFNKPETREAINSLLPELDLHDPEIQDAVLNFTVPTSILLQLHRAGRMAYHNAPRITCPTTIIQGTKDELVLPQNTRKLLTRFKTHPDYIELEGEHTLFHTHAPSWGDVSAALQTVARRYAHLPHEMKAN